jgi:phenylpropionate dioxygenase-like ring-hydroxylating dioxygenase large terminal subunit
MRRHARADAPSVELPPSAYVSRDVLERELHRVFQRHWLLAADMGELPTPGDFVTVKVGSLAVAVIRDLDGNLRAFHNFCRHRHVTLLHGKGNAGPRLECLYHGWQYALDGRLTYIPQLEIGPDRRVDPGTWHLTALVVDSWHGLVFVNASNRPVAPVASGLDLLAGSNADSLVRTGQETVRVACNWK